MKKIEIEIQELILFFQQGKIVNAFDLARSLSRKYPNIHVVFEILGLAAAQLKKYEIAEKSFQKLIRLKPDYAQGYYNLGNVLLSIGKVENAATAYSQAIGKMPGFLDAYLNLGICLTRQEKFDQAIETYRKAAKVAPDNPRPVLENGNMLIKQNKYAEALLCFDKALELKPDFAEAHNRRGVSLYHLQKFPTAYSSFSKAIEFNQDNARYYFNRARCSKESGNLEIAVDDYRTAINIRPSFPEALNNLAIILNEQGHVEQSIDFLEKAISADPTYYFALNNLGNFYKNLGDLDRAIDAYKKAVDLNNEYFEAYYNLGEVLEEQGKIDQAITAFQLSLKINADYDKARLGIFAQKRKICDWTDIVNDKESYAKLGINSKPVSPHMLLCLEDHPERQLKRAENFWNNKNVSPIHHAKEINRPDKGKIRVGFFSADIKDHPVLHMSSGLFREYDRLKFEVHLFSYGRPDDSHLRGEVANTVDFFHDVHELPDIDLIRSAKEHKLDIAIDMMGYTKSARYGMFAHRLAPVQINYLGYPGTLGSHTIDYIMADKHVIGDGQDTFYTERVIYMPDSFFPSDNRREIATDPKTRSHHGLPEDGVVFCCFNSSYKISPDEFDIWMRIMRKTPGSVLWLSKGNDQSTTNLIHEANNRNVDGDRLIFAERTPKMKDHLARLQHADLFLDCFNYNAHSTASDALWAGVPLVTKQGEQFSARVASSLLHALGLDELVTRSTAEYENRILGLAHDKSTLQDIRKKLAKNRLSHPLFDTKRYVKNFERGLEQAFNAYHKGIKNQNIYLYED